MRKLISFNLITLDSFFEGANQDISWHNVDAEFNEFAIEQSRSGDTLLFGRVTYQLMASYWPTPDAIKNDPIVADYMNRTPKIVVSRTLEKAEWNNTQVVMSRIMSPKRSRNSNSNAAKILPCLAVLICCQR
jgi:dihydrofolate reductase